MGLRGTVLPLACACAALLALGSSGRAAESATASEDSIAKAKRDYDSIKASRSEAARPASSATAASLPRLEIQADEAPVLSPIQRARNTEALEEKARQTRSKNWLVDALDKKSNADLEAQESMLLAKPDVADSKIAVKTNSDRQSVKRATDLQSKSKKTAVEAPNPLGAFMSGWMTPKDFELLQLHSHDAVVGKGTSAPSSLQSPLLSLTPSSPGPRFGGDLPGGVPLATAARSQNPYLPELSPGFGSVTGARPNSVPPSVSTLLMPRESSHDTVQPDLTKASGTQPIVAEPFKPQHDGPEFKQLKRF